MAIFKANIERQAKFHMKDFKLNVDMIDMPNFITKMENAINEKKEGFEQDLKDIFTEIKEGNVDLVSTSTS
jgi:uncharacterized protein (UPF0335 family)